MDSAPISRRHGGLGAGMVTADLLVNDGKEAEDGQAG